MNKKCENWEKITPDKWEKHTPPFRPSVGDIKNYEEITREIVDKNKILILGATPEIRDIADQMDANTIVADFSYGMLGGMLKLAKRASAVREKWIIADWFSLDEFLKNNYFDLIMGDLILRNIEPESQDKFLQKISALLTSGGLFVTRIHFINEDILKPDAIAVIRKSFDEYSILEDKFLEDFISSRLFDKNTNFEFHAIDKENFWKDIKLYLGKYTRNEKEKNVLRNIYDKWSKEITWTQRTPQEIEILLKKFFVIKGFRTAIDYPDAEFYPVYILSKRNIRET